MSELILQSELQNPRIARARDLPEVRCPHSQSRTAQVRMVQEIKKLRAELHSLPLRKSERLINREIPVECSRTEESSITEVARRVRSRSGKRSRVEPPVQGRIFHSLRTAQVIRARIALAGVQGIARDIDGQRTPALAADDAGHVPTAKQQFCGAASGHEPAPSA